MFRSEKTRIEMAEIPVNASEVRGRTGGIVASFSPARRREFDQLVAEGVRPSAAAERVLDSIMKNIEEKSQ